jgi:hypothetical protein
MLDPHLEEWALLGRHILVLLDGIELIRDYLKLILLQTIKNVLH